MATTVARLEAILTANTANFERAMTTSETRMKHVGRVAGVAGAAIVGGLAFGLEKSVKAALDAQTSQVRLATAFKTSHVSATRYAAEVVNLESKSRKLGFTDEQVKESLGSLLIATHSMSKASHDLSVAQDVARFRHVDLAAATKMLTMAMAGSQRATKQLGIDVPKVTSTYDALKAQFGSTVTASEKLQLAQAKLIDKHKTEALVIETVSQKLHGQSDAFAQTAQGSMEQFRAQLNHLEVSMGTGLLPILAKVSSALAKATDYFTRHKNVLKVVIIALGILGTALLAARTAQLLLNLAVLANPYVAALAAITLLIGGLIYLQVKYHAVTNAIQYLIDHYYILLALPIVGWALAGAAAIYKNWDRIKGLFNDIVGVIKTVVHWLKVAAGLAGSVNPFGGSAPPGGGSNRGGGGKGSGGHGTGIHSSAKQAQGYALGQSQSMGFGGSFNNLVSLWNQESGWHWNALNASSGAYGIPQSLPASKMASAGSDWHDNAFTQVNWGLNYIAGRYGNPSNAWAHEKAFGWYDRGGWLPPGLSLALNTTGKPERVGGGGPVVFNFPNYVGSRDELMSAMRQAAQIFQRRNGYPAFGGA